MDEDRAGLAEAGQCGMSFVVSHAAEDAFRHDGLRPFFEYRDLGIRQATGGKVGAHVIRARAGEGAKGGWHRHALDFQMVYVLKGWVRFRYEGVGEVLLEAGSCVHQPPGIRHAEIAHSDDVEMLEITLPAEFETTGADPACRVPRDAGGVDSGGPESGPSAAGRDRGAGGAGARAQNCSSSPPRSQPVSSGISSGRASAASAAIASPPEEKASASMLPISMPPATPMAVCIAPPRKPPPGRCWCGLA
jgi:quercetin dioxygenase-like cupin family protein